MCLLLLLNSIKYIDQSSKHKKNNIIRVTYWTNPNQHNTANQLQKWSTNKRWIKNNTTHIPWYICLIWGILFGGCMWFFNMCPSCDMEHGVHSILIGTTICDCDYENQYQVVSCDILHQRLHYFIKRYNRKYKLCVI